MYFNKNVSLQSAERRLSVVQISIVDFEGKKVTQNQGFEIWMWRKYLKNKIY